MSSLLTFLKRPHVLTATLLLLGSIVVTVTLSVRGASDHPPSGLDNLLLLIFAAVLQVAAAGVLSQDGRVNPAHSRSARRRVKIILDLAMDSEELLRKVDGSCSDQELRIALVEAMKTLDTISREAVSSLLDWDEFDLKTGGGSVGGVAPSRQRS